MKTTIQTSLALAAAFALASCGDSGSPSSDSGASPGSAGTVSADGFRKIHLTGNDQLQYNTNAITMKAGETIVIEMENIGRMPRQAMAHNFVLLKPMPEGEVAAFGMAGASKPPEHLPDDLSAVLFHTRMLGPGEKEEIKVTIQEPGAYPYLCTFPGHFALMKGVLTVEPAAK